MNTKDIQSFLGLKLHKGEVDYETLETIAQVVAYSLPFSIENINQKLKMITRN
jgi:ABC-type Fe3+-hydroxamate transport system substrate-binding protein